MSTITYLLVEAASGHYRVPGQVKSGASCFPIAPPSTIQGFLESLMGLASGTFPGSFSYGQVGDFQGFGVLLRRAHVWSSSNKVKIGNVTHKFEVSRPIHIPTYFGCTYVIAVKDVGDLLDRALKGDVDRFGILSLGESDDVVTWLQQIGTLPEDISWVEEGGTVALPVKSGRGYTNLNAVYGQFNIKSETGTWFSPTASQTFGVATATKSTRKSGGNSKSKAVPMKHAPSSSGSSPTM